MKELWKKLQMWLKNNKKAKWGKAKWDYEKWRK